MRALARWRPWHVAVACAAWLLLAPLLAGAGLVLAGVILDAVSGRRDVALRVAITGWSAVTGLLLPPALLVAAWLRARSGAAASGRGTLTYEITAIVRDDLRAAYEQYMRTRHIPDLLATGAFAAASLGRSEPGRYRIRYEARDRAALERYLEVDAPRLRQHFAATFPTGVELAREEWSVLASLHAPRR